MQCYDDYTKDIAASVGSDWKQVTISFAELHQAGWGAKVPLDLSKGFGLQFKFPPPSPDAGISVDFWLVNLAFTGAGGGGTPDAGGTVDSGGSVPDSSGPSDAPIDKRDAAADVSNSVTEQPTWRPVN
jgi:hypothetical protein